MQKITFTTNITKNTLDYVKLLMESLRCNLDSDEHEILIFVDADNENSLEYLLTIKEQFKDLRIIKNTSDAPIGYARNCNLLTEYAKHDIISYLQSDMVIGPHYDTEISKHIKRGRILSATRVEPPLHGESPTTITKNFGLHPAEFDLQKWNLFSESVKRDGLLNYFFAPITYYKEDWMRLGGYDTLFRRSREDSDLVQRCLHAGIELVQTFSANVYHFTCVTSRGNNWFDQTNEQAQRRVEVQSQADNIELRRFIRKWGNFNHGDNTLQKLDIDLVAHNYHLNIIEQIEPFFSRVWLNSIADKNTLLERYDKYHSVANYLLDATDETWNSMKHLYRIENFDRVFMVGEPSDFSIKVDIDFNKINAPNLFLNNLVNLRDLLSEYTSGKYELDGVLIDIKAVTSIPASVKIENPPFDDRLLTIY